MEQDRSFHLESLIIYERSVSRHLNWPSNPDPFDTAYVDSNAQPAWDFVHTKPTALMFEMENIRVGSTIAVCDNVHAQFSPEVDMIQTHFNL